MSLEAPRLCPSCMRHPAACICDATAFKAIADSLRCSRRHVERLIAEKSCRRKVGRKVLIERAGLLALTRRG